MELRSVTPTRTGTSLTIIVGSYAGGAYKVNRAITHPSPSSAFTISYHPPTQEVRIYVNDQLIRKVNAFAHIPGFIAAQGQDLSEWDQSEDGGKGKKVFIGVMAASPMGEGGVAEFEDLEYRQGVRPAI